MTPRTARRCSRARQSLLAMRGSGEIGDDTFHTLENDLDWMEVSGPLRGLMRVRRKRVRRRKISRPNLLPYANYVHFLKATFVELPPFERLRPDYLEDAAYRELQSALMANPEAGAVIEGTGGLRKLRRPDPRRGKGTRGGLRVIYYWWNGGDQFWLFTVYDKDQADDLTPQQRRTLRELLKQEIEQRQKPKGKTS
jgi:hypothetical protein